MFVSRTAYDALQRECDKWASLYENLLEKYHALRLLNNVPRPEAEKVTPVAAPTSDIDLVYNTQRQMAIESAYEDFIARGMTPEQAKQEAQRTIDSIFAPIAGEFQ